MEKEFLKIPVSTVDSTKKYKVIRPVFTQLSNKSITKGSFHQLSKEYASEIQEALNSGLIRNDWSLGNLFDILFTADVGQNNFDEAFQIGIMELQKKAYLLGADAVIGMHTDIDLDTTGFQYFYLQMYGTAIEYIGEDGFTRRERVENYWKEHQTAYNTLLRQLNSLQSQLKNANDDSQKREIITKKIAAIEEELLKER